MSGLSHPRKVEVTRFIASATERQKAILFDLAEVRYLSTSQVMRLHYSGADFTEASAARMARRDLARLAELGAVVRLKHRAGYRPTGRATVFGLGGLGRRVIETMSGQGIPRQRTYREPGGAFIEHTLAVTEVYVRLREAERHGLLSVKAFAGEPGCWRTYLAAGGASAHLKPDAHAVTTAEEGFEDSWFVEVDLDTERRGALETKLAAYLAYFRSGGEQARTGVFPRVIWLVPDTARRQFLEDIIEKLGAPEGLFTVMESRDLNQGFTRKDKS